MKHYSHKNVVADDRPTTSVAYYDEIEKQDIASFQILQDAKPEIVYTVTPTERLYNKVVEFWVMISSLSTDAIEK